MASIITETIYFVLSYISIIVIFFLILNFMTKGFFSSFLRVKASKGKKILAAVKSKTDIYYTTALIVNGAFVYKTRNGIKKTIVEIPDGTIYPALSIFCVNVDEDKDIFYTVEGNAKPGPNAAVIDSFINRAIIAPKPEDKFKIFVIAALAIIALVAIATLVTCVGLTNELAALKAISGNI